MPIVNPTAETHPERYGYRMPEMPRISREHGKLYQAENARDRALERCAEQAGRILGLADLFREQLPEAIAALLEHWDAHAADAAAIAYLRKRGYLITDKTEGF